MGILVKGDILLQLEDVEVPVGESSRRGSRVVDQVEMRLLRIDEE